MTLKVESIRFFASRTQKSGLRGLASSSRFAVFSVLLACSGPELADGSQQLRDHSHLKNSDLTVNIFTKAMKDGTIQAFYTLKHPFTNTLECDIRLSVPVRGAKGERFIQTTLRNEFVFPEAAFPETPHHYEIDVSTLLVEGESVSTNFEKQFASAASCQGFSPSKRLPRSVCTTLVSNHDEMCSLAGEIGKYPVTRNGQFLGICGCP